MRSSRPCEDTSMPAPRFTADDRPADILDTSGRWLAEELGWRWVKSRHTAEILTGSLTLQLRLQSSTWSRAGLATWTRTRVIILDKDLQSWRLARPRETVFPDSHLPPFACNTMLASVIPELGDVELSGLLQQRPAPHMISFAEFVVSFRDDVLPVLDLFRSSRLLANKLPNSWFTTIDSGMIEQALARNDPESASALIRKYMERPLKATQTWQERIGAFRKGWEKAPGQSPGPQHGPGALGWLARIHNLPGTTSYRQPKSEADDPSASP
jgi:hypothetical protein